MQQDKKGIPFWPEQASSLAWDVDVFYAAMVGVSVFTTVLIAGVLVYFAVKYRRRDGDYRPPHIETSKMLEIVWSVIPLILVMGMFFWGTELYFRQSYIPENAMNIDVTGKQWMFKFQHPNGRREINTLHVPMGVPVRLTMASEDVIHDLFIPDFRIKKDLVPGRYSSTWFQAIKPGTYHLFCNQYCGTQHSSMIGSVIVMPPNEYQNWLAGFTGETPAQAGEALFSKHACNTCHSMDGSGGRGPSLIGLLGNKVQLLDGRVVVADKTYLRESILKPQAKVVAGYTPIMPSYQGLLGEEEVNHLIAYIETLQGGAAGQQASAHAAGEPSVQAAAASATGQAGGVRGSEAAQSKSPTQPTDAPSTSSESTTTTQGVAEPPAAAPSVPPDAPEQKQPAPAPAPAQQTAVPAATPAAEAAATTSPLSTTSTASKEAQ